MKNIFLILSLLVSTLTAHAYCRVDTTYKYNYPTNGTNRDNVGRYIYSYTADSLVSTYQYQPYDAATSSFLQQGRTLYQYNAAKKIVLETYQGYSTSTSTWNDVTRKYYFYSTAGYLIRDSVSQRGTPTWTLAPRKTYTLNSDGNPIVILYESVNSSTNTYVLSSRTTISYSGLLSVADTIRYYNQSTSTWDNGSITEYTRNGFGAVTQKVHYSWNTGIADYYPSSRDIYTITGIDKVTFQTQERKASPTSSWVFKTKAFQNYDFVNNTLLERKDLDYDAANNSWDTTRRTVYTYNGSIDLVAKDIYYFDIDSQKYNVRDREEYHCAQLNIGITEPSASIQFIVYPNPISSGIIHINTIKEADYLLLDIAGKELQKGTLSMGDNQILFPIISSGVYFVKVGNQIVKLMVQ